MTGAGLDPDTAAAVRDLIAEAIAHPIPSGEHSFEAEEIEVIDAAPQADGTTRYVFEAVGWWQLAQPITGDEPRERVSGHIDVTDDLEPALDEEGRARFDGPQTPMHPKLWHPVARRLGLGTATVVGAGELAHKPAFWRPGEEDALAERVAELVDAHGVAPVLPDPDIEDLPRPRDDDADETRDAFEAAARDVLRDQAPGVDVELSSDLSPLGTAFFRQRSEGGRPPEPGCRPTEDGGWRMRGRADDREVDDG